MKCDSYGLVKIITESESVSYFMKLEYYNESPVDFTVQK